MHPQNELFKVNTSVGSSRFTVLCRHPQPRPEGDPCRGLCLPAASPRSWPPRPALVPCITCSGRVASQASNDDVQTPVSGCSHQAPCFEAPRGRVCTCFAPRDGRAVVRCTSVCVSTPPSVVGLRGRVRLLAPVHRAATYTRTCRLESPVLSSFGNIRAEPSCRMVIPCLTFRETPGLLPSSLGSAVRVRGAGRLPAVGLVCRLIRFPVVVAVASLSGRRETGWRCRLRRRRVSAPCFHSRRQHRVCVNTHTRVCAPAFTGSLGSGSPVGDAFIQGCLLIDYSALSVLTSVLPFWPLIFRQQYLGDTQP